MFSVVLVMAGLGTRMQAEKNKALLMLGKKPIFMYALETFLSLDSEVILVINPIDEAEIKPYIPSNVKLAYGGRTRQESVYNGLLLATCDYVMIHDAARAFISTGVIFKALHLLNGDNAVFVGKYVTDTIRQKREGRYVTIPRETLVHAETPQCATTNLLIEVHRRAKNDEFETTDDIALIEKYSDVVIEMIEGNFENFKITSPFDMIAAKAIIGDKNV